MDKIFKALESLIPVIAGHPLTSAMFGAFLVVVIFILTVRAQPQILDKIFAPKRGQKHLLDSISCGAKIQEELTKLLGSTGADKVSLWLYRNGAASLSGVPYLNTKIDYISTKNGVAFNDQLMSQYTPLTAFADYMGEMWADPKDPKFVRRDRNSITHPLLQSQLVLGNTNLAFATPVRDMHGNAAGMLFLSYQTKTAPHTDEELEHDCRNASLVISALLDQMSDRKPWWSGWRK